jgi:hypothetical protein
MIDIGHIFWVVLTVVSGFGLGYSAHALLESWISKK